MKIIVVAGARPNFMKVSPFFGAITRYNSQLGLNSESIESLLVHTGQHYDDNMSDVFFRELGIRRPDINLGVGSASHAVQSARIMIAFEPICEKEKPDWVVVVGDVNSTMACTIVCAKMGIKVAHIEAGLRSYDRTMPEEINRIVTDALADMLFTPSEDADQNLLHEGIPEKKIRLVGNIMIDSLVESLPKARSSGVMAEYGLAPKGFVYVTLHRPSNVDYRSSLTAVLDALGYVAKRLPVIFPVHPRTRRMFDEFGLKPKESLLLKFVAPIGYHRSLCLTENARLVLTDSGGLQEEATYFRTPCLTLRPNTERPITVIMGSNRLTNLDSLIQDIDRSLRGPERVGQVPPLWDGRTGIRSLEHLLQASRS